MEEPDLAAATPRGELEPSQGVDRGSVWVAQRADVTHDLIAISTLQQRVRALAQRRYLRRDDPPGDGQDDREVSFPQEVSLDRPLGDGKLIAADQADDALGLALPIAWSP